MLESGSFDVVLMDVQMPRRDGLQATALIRQREAVTGRHVPIIAMTAQALKGDVERCLHSGMDGYLPKPLSPTELIRLIESQHAAAETAVDADSTLPGVFDADTALARACGKAGLLCELIELSLADFPIQLDLLESAVETENSLQLEHAAHRLKGTMLNIGAARAATAAQRIEDTEHRCESEGLATAHSALRDEIRHLVPRLREFLEAQLAHDR